MVKELHTVDITHYLELLEAVQSIRRTNEPLIFRQASQNAASVRLIKRSTSRRIPRGNPFAKDDPIWNLNGIGRSGVSDVSENIDRYLAEAYLYTHTDQE